MLKINIISKYLLKKLYESTTIGKYIFDTNAKNWQTIEIAKYIGNLYILLRSVYSMLYAINAKNANLYSD